MATCLFRSSLAFRLQTFLETRRAAGRDDVATQKILIYLDRFLMAEAAKASPTLLTRNVTPHTIRHTTAMHLLQSNVDLIMIRSWLGHASIETTNGYVEIDLEMKRKTLQSCEKLLSKKGKQGPSWQRNNDMLSWLSKL
jgi:integrase